MKTPLTLFSFGYHGWGTATNKLIQAVDAVETGRGYEPPVFVDVRYKRSGRAPGFNGTKFARTVGSERYEWMPELGNKAIDNPTGPRIQIVRPAAAEELLTRAQALAAQNRRLLFFCHCLLPYPTKHPKSCHRSTVADLVLAAARRRAVDARVVEWPGGEPTTAVLRVTRLIWRQLEKRHAQGEGLQNIPLGTKRPDPKWLGLPWGSVIHAQLDIKNALAVVAGPANYARGHWQIPVWDVYGVELELDMATRYGLVRRRQEGYEAKSAGK